MKALILLDRKLFLQSGVRYRPGPGAKSFVKTLDCSLSSFPASYIYHKRSSKGEVGEEGLETRLIILYWHPALDYC